MTLYVFLASHSSSNSSLFRALHKDWPRMLHLMHVPDVRYVIPVQNHHPQTLKGHLNAHSTYIIWNEKIQMFKWAFFRKWAQNLFVQKVTINWNPLSTNMLGLGLKFSFLENFSNKHWFLLPVYVKPIFMFPVYNAFKWGMMLAKSHEKQLILKYLFLQNYWSDSNNFINNSGY